MKSYAFLILFFAFAAIVQAEEPQGRPAPLSKPPGTFAEWDALKTENMLLDARVKNAELKNKLRALNPDGTPNISLSAPVGAPSRAIQVQMVSGSGAKMQAMLCMPSGGAMVVMVGTKVPGLGTIKAVSINAVIVESASGPSPIPFASENVCAYGATAFPTTPGQQQFGVPLGSRQ